MATLQESGGSQRGAHAFAILSTLLAVLSLWSAPIVPMLFVFDDDGSPIPKLLGFAALCLAPPLLCGLAAARAWVAARRGRPSPVAVAVLSLAIVCESALAGPTVMNWINPPPKVMTAFANGRPCLQIFRTKAGRTTTKTFPGNPCPGKFNSGDLPF